MDHESQCVYPHHFLKVEGRSLQSCSKLRLLPSLQTFLFTNQLHAFIKLRLFKVTWMKHLLNMHPNRRNKNLKKDNIYSIEEAGRGH